MGQVPKVAVVPLELVPVTQKGFHENDPLLMVVVPLVCVALKEPLEPNFTQLLVPSLLVLQISAAWACGVGPSRRQPPTTAVTAVADPMVVSVRSSSRVDASFQRSALCAEMFL